MLTEQRFALLFKNLFALDMTLCQLRPRRLTIKTGRHQNFPKYVFGTYRKPKNDAFNTSTSFPLSIFASHKCRKTNSAVVDCFHTSNHTLFFFYKNIFYKNIEAEICEILRIL